MIPIYSTTILRIIIRNLDIGEQFFEQDSRLLVKLFPKITLFGVCNDVIANLLVAYLTLP